jgi:hypothetical protein
MKYTSIFISKALQNISKIWIFYLYHLAALMGLYVALDNEAGKGIKIGECQKFQIPNSIRLIQLNKTERFYCHYRVVCVGYFKYAHKYIVLKNYFLTIYFSLVHICTQWQCILSYDNSTAMYKFLKTLHPGGNRTRDLLFCRRTRWPLCDAARATLYIVLAHAIWNGARIFAQICFSIKYLGCPN